MLSKAQKLAMQNIVVPRATLHLVLGKVGFISRFSQKKKNLMTMVASLSSVSVINYFIAHTHTPVMTAFFSLPGGEERSFGQLPYFCDRK